MFDDEMLRRIVERYPPVDEITPTEFETYVSEVLRAAGQRSGLPFELELHQTIVAHDGSYDFDAVATYEVLGMKHTLLIEAKRHRSPIKRELVQTLHAKLQSVGAQKALLVAAGRFQSGAIRYALEHGVALATLSEGRFTLEVRSETKPPLLTREQAADLGLPPLTAHASYR